MNKMKYLPLHIINFSTQYRMGCISAPIKFIMNELNAAACPPESISYLSGLFKEESDVIFIGFSRYTTDKKNGHITIFSDDVETVHPLSRDASKIMAQLIQKELISEPVENGLRNKLIVFRNKELAERGSGFLMRLFGIEDTSFLDGLGKVWYKSIEKYIADQNFATSTLPECLMTYERTKNFNKNAIGILEDTASLIKQFYGLPDGYQPSPVNEDETLFPGNGKLFSEEPGSSKGVENHHDWVYTRLKKIAEVRRELLDLKEVSFISILERVNSDRVFNEFNEDLRAVESEPERWFQVIMIYLQFRLKIREGIQGDDAGRFYYFVKDVLIVMPKETITALFLMGHRFGINEFVPLFVFVKNPPKFIPAELPITQLTSDQMEYKPVRNYWNNSPGAYKLRQEDSTARYTQNKQSPRKRKEK